MVEKRNARVDSAFAFAVEVERDADVCFSGLSFDFSLTRHKRLQGCHPSYANSAFNAAINLSFSSGVPTLMRTYSPSIGALLTSRIRMPRAYRASNNSLGGIAVLTQKKFAADGTGMSPLICCNSANSRSRSLRIFSTRGASRRRFSSATSAAVIEKKFRLYGIFALLNSRIRSGAARQ